MPYHPVPAAGVSSDQRAILTTWAQGRVLSHRRVLRARIVLLAAAAHPNSRIASQLGCSIPAVQLWRRPFAEAGVSRLEQDAPGRGRPRVYDERTVAKIISVTLGRPPKGETHWTGPGVAAELGVSPSTVPRSGATTRFNPNAAAASSSAPTRNWRPRSPMWWVSTCIRRRRRLFCAWMRSRKSRRWTALNRCCR
jgi:transposase